MNDFKDKVVYQIYPKSFMVHTSQNQAMPFFLPTLTVSTKGTTMAMTMHSAKLSI